MAGGCCCMKPQNAILVTSGILIVGWTVQLVLSGYRFYQAVDYSKNYPELRAQGGNDRVGVTGLLLIVDLAQTALSILLLSATFKRDLNKLHPWFILSAIILFAYVPLSIAACLVKVATQAELILAWILLLVTVYTFWLVKEFKREFATVSLERLL